ncbi:MAG: Gfo/Idh/MocA family oxidoreductase [Chloroflexi bacterium]|nr:Gfo/Idh/MocA family oxidoreductase [Chloroflexota bacterium]
MKILMVGLGGIGQRHVRNLRALLGSDVDILAYRVRRLSQTITDQLSIEAAVEVEEKYNLHVYYDLDEALEQKPEAVFICNPSSLHMPIAIKAARAGCHLFIEKPLSHNEEQVQDLIDLIESQHLVSLVGYQMRFHPCLRRLHSLLQQQAVGRVLAVRAEVGEFLPGWHKYEDYRQIYASRQELGGGVILTQIHELDYIYWLFGLPKRIFALGGHLSNLEINVEDTASILMEYIVKGRQMPVHLHQDFVQRPPSRTCQIIGDEGKILVDLHALTVNVFDGRGSLTEANSYEGFQRNQLFLDELKHFLECLQGKTAPLVTVRDGAQSLRMALAAKESLATGQLTELMRQPS